jgi:hypothetical protein
VLTTTTRPLSAGERADLEARRGRLEHLIAADLARGRRVHREAARAALLFPLLFATITALGLWWRIPGRMVAAWAGATALSAALPAWLWRGRDEHSPPLLEQEELESVTAALAEDAVVVTEITATDAVVICDPDHPERLVGDVLRVGPDQIVYVSRSTCAAVDPAQLPSTRLRVAVARPLRVLEATAHGEVIAREGARVIADGDPYDFLLSSELVAFDLDFARLVEELRPAER